MQKIPALCGTAFLCLALTFAHSQPLINKYRQVAIPFIDNPTGTAETFQPDILAQSPEAEAMIKSALLPMTLYSGLPNVSVPIYEFKTKSLDVPVSLAYTYNGFKPAEVASYVGLGWSVAGGGVITRMVKSRVDHQDPNVVNDYDSYVAINLTTSKQTLLQSTALGQIDGEPDIYVFNCNGMSGKFILMQGQAYLFPYQKVRVATSANGGFILTSEKGDQYIFSTTEWRHHHQLRGTDYVPDHVSAWYLTQIVSADLSDTINYSYNPYTFTQPPVYSEIYTVTLPHGSSVVESDPQTLTEVASSGDVIDAQQLSSISYKNTTVNFNPDPTPRSDIFFNDGSLTALGTINITSQNGTALTKSFSLQHQYFNGKMSLTEVDVTTPPPNDGGGIDSSTLQRYQFQYYNQNLNASAVPGFSTHSIDYYGYFNGQNNDMLFTTNDVVNTSYPAANRIPAPSYGQYNMLSQITYPTGGYATFNYEQNQTGHYIVTGLYQNVYSTAYDTVSWPGTDPGPPSGYYSSGASFTINQAQPIKIARDVYDPEPLTDTIIKLFNASTGAEVLSIPPPLSSQVTDTLYMESSLPAGTYNIYVYVNKKGANVAATPVFYNREPIIYNTLGPAPGLRVKTVSHYDNTNSSIPSLVKQYSYQNGVGFFKNGTSVHIVFSHGHECGLDGEGNQQPDQDIMTLQAGLYAPTSDLLNNEFYYQNVEETDVGPTNIGKTDYTYNCFAPDDPDVFLTQQIVYGYNGADYIPLHKTISNYAKYDKYTFQTYTAVLTHQLPPNGENCTGTPTPDGTQPVAYLPLVYGATHNSLPMGYKQLNSTIDSVWDMNGENPMSSETDYTYSNPDYLYPTKITKTDSKGQLNNTYLKYSLDYPVRPTLTLNSLDTAFTNWENNCIGGYNACYDSLVSALQPYSPYLNYPTQFTSIANSFHCETEYQGNSGLVFSARNNQLKSYLASIDSARYADPVAWHQPIYWMQGNNVFNPVIEQYSTVTKSDGNEYLVAAARNDYALLTDASGDTVAKPTELEAVELNTPLLYSTFTANTNAYYKPQVYMSYDAHMGLVSQRKINNVKYNYLWGYNHQFPVAEIEGSDTATIASFINQSVLDNPSSDLALRQELNKVRTGLIGTKALVTTCTYDPLVGITSKTDPAGRTAYFEYDGMGWLIDIKDLNGNIVKTYSYHLVQ